MVQSKIKRSLHVQTENYAQGKGGGKGIRILKSVFLTVLSEY